MRTPSAIDTLSQDPQSSPDDVRLLVVDTEDARARWRAGFIGAYQTVFARAPFFERFSPSEAEGIWLRLTAIPENITIVALSGSDKVVGFAAGMPLRFERAVSRELTGLVAVSHTFYFAELGVLPEYRGRGLARAMVRARLERIHPERYRAVVLRAPASRSGNFRLYTPMGFQDMGVTMDVANLRVDGRVSTDRRVFLHCVMSQVRLDNAPAMP